MIKEKIPPEKRLELFALKKIKLYLHNLTSDTEVSPPINEIIFFIKASFPGIYNLKQNVL